MNVYKDYLKVSEEEKEEFFGQKGSPLYLLTGMASFMNIEEVDRKKVSEKLKKTYAEKSEINAKLQRRYKSRIRKKIKAFRAVRAGKETAGEAFSGKICFGKV